MNGRVSASAKKIRRLKGKDFILDISMSNPEFFLDYRLMGKKAFDVVERYANDMFLALETTEGNLWGIYHTNDMEYCISYDYAVLIPRIQMHGVWELVNAIKEIEKRLDFSDKDLHLYTRVWKEFKYVERWQPLWNRIISNSWF